MVYVLQNIDPKEDSASLARVMMSAMFENKYWRLSFPGLSLEEIIAGAEKRIPKNLITNRDAKRYQKAVDVETGEIVGYARWVMPESRTDEWQETKIPTPSDEDVAAFEESWASEQEDGHNRGQNMVFGRETGAPLQAVNDEIIAQGPTLELEYLAVSPAHQRKGIGALLVKSGLEQADKMNVQTYVMSANPGVRLYTQCGFEQFRIIVQDTTKYGGSPGMTTTFMIRPIPVLKVSE